MLAPSTSDKSSRVVTKKFHISEFRSPYMPDQDREELPYSSSSLFDLPCSEEIVGAVYVD